MREQAMNPGNPRMGEMPKPVLDRQPALPGAAVRMFNPEEERSFEKALVPVKPYGEREEESSWVEESNQDWRTPPVTFHEGQYNMDHNTLMFIAGQQRPQQ